MTNGILPKFCEEAILMETLLSNDEATLLLILDWISALQKHTAYIYNGVEQTHPQLPGLAGRMHLLFRDIAHELLDTVMGTQNLTSSLGNTRLEELLFQRLKNILYVFDFLERNNADAPGFQDSLLPAFPCKKFVNGQDL